MLTQWYLSFKSSRYHYLNSKWWSTRINCHLFFFNFKNCFNINSKVHACGTRSRNKWTAFMVKDACSMKVQVCGITCQNIQHCKIQLMSSKFSYGNNLSMNELMIILNYFFITRPLSGLYYTACFMYFVAMMQEHQHYYSTVQLLNIWCWCFVSSLLSVL